MRKSLVALALVGCTLSGAAWAQQTPPAPPPPPPGGGMGMAGLMRADINGDGVVTREEAIAASDAQFERLDANHDGKVTGEEMRAAFEAMRGGSPGGPGGPGGGRMGGRFGGGDMTMTREDMRARALARFDRADANHDGQVDQTEMEAMRQMRMNRRGGPDAPPPPPAGE